MFIDGREVILYTPHGSHLYGINHAASDEDFYAVVTDRKVNKYADASQSIVDKKDVTVVGYSKFLAMCHKGVPQALEALMSPMATVDEIEAFRAGYVIAGNEVISTYLRTIKSFTLDEREGKQPKLRRHAVRLALNLNDIVESGRFTPVLTSEQAEFTREVSLLPLDELKAELGKISGFQVF